MVDFAKQLKKPRLDLNPSSADRWTTCTASPKFLLENADKLPIQDTVFSQEGTTAHEVASAFLQGREPNVKDPYCCPVPVNKEMRLHGWDYAEYVLGLKNGDFAELLVEQKLPLWYMPGRNAIVDAAVINHDSLHIVDYKYGAGVVVSPIDSLQATIYAKSIIVAQKLKLPPDFPVTIHIYQPRGRASVDAPFHVWETTLYGVESLAGFVERSAAKVLLGGSDLVFAPSDKACQWCPAKGSCTARIRHLTGDIKALAVIDNTTPKLPLANTISTDQLSAIVKHKDQLVKWLNDAEAYALQFMKGGGKLPGFKLVTSRGGNRYWSNPKAAEKLLLKTILKREEVIEEKVIGPAAAEKLLGKDKFNVALANLVAKPPGQPVIAPMDDKREECLVDGKTEFDSLEEY